MNKDTQFLVNMSALLLAFSMLFLHDPIYRVGSVFIIISSAAVATAAFLNHKRINRILYRR